MKPREIFINTILSEILNDVFRLIIYNLTRSWLMKLIIEKETRLNNVLYTSISKNKSLTKNYEMIILAQWKSYLKYVKLLKI